MKVQLPPAIVWHAVDGREGAVPLVLDEAQSIAKMARGLDLTESVFRTWVGQVGADRGMGKPGMLTSEERDELRQRRKKARKPRLVREIGKKTAAFFAKENA